MLKTNKNITLTGQSMIGDKQAAFMSATISTDGNTNANINTNIADATIYAANKVECRKDISDFQAKVYAIQDEIVADTATAN